MAVSLPQWKATLGEKAQTITKAFSTPDGKAALEILEQTFQRGALFHESATKTAFNVGQYELVEYIKTMIEANNHE